MLFDRRGCPGWLSRIPEVVHVHGSARLQTVDAGQNPVITELLTEYARLSSVPGGSCGAKECSGSAANVSPTRPKADGTSGFLPCMGRAAG